MALFIKHSLVFRFSPIITNHLRTTDSASYVLQNVVFSRNLKRWVKPTRMAMRKRLEAMDPQPNPRNLYAEWNYNSELFAFGKRLNEEFNKEHLQRAFIERSYIVMEEEKQKKVGIDDPQVLLKDNSEFVKKGESFILEFCKRYLRLVYPRYPEEGISAVSEYLISDDVLADISKNLGTTDLILTSEYPPNITTLANVLKAIVIALEESSGTEQAYLFVRDFVISYLSGKDINELWVIHNPENLLSSILKREGRPSVEARLVGDAGRNTILASFQVGLYSCKELIGIGVGESITVAKEMAALNALKRLFQTTECCKPIPFDLKLSAERKEPFANISIQDWCEKNVHDLMSNSQQNTGVVK